jgi:Flp pilus assembly protein TadD
MVLKRALWAVLFVAVSAAAWAQSLSGSYRIVQDSDGTKPKGGAVVELTFGQGTFTFRAVMPGETVDDKGTYSLRGNTITMEFAEMEQGRQSGPYSLSNGLLTLPFMMFSNKKGTSTWRSSWTPPEPKGKPSGDASPLTEVLRQTLRDAQSQDNASQRQKMDVAATKEAADYKGGMAEAYYAQGIAFFLRGYLFEAWYAFAKAANMEPFNAVYLNNLSTTLLELEQFEPATIILKWLADAFPNLEAPFGALGIAYVKGGECEKGRRALERAMVLDPENGMYDFAYGKALSCLGRKDEAKRYFTAAWNKGYSGDDGGDGEGGAGGETGEGGSGSGSSGSGPGGSGGSGGHGGPGGGTGVSPGPTRRPPSPGGRGGEQRGIPAEWVGHWEAKYVRARSGENAREANTQFGQGMTGTNINLQTLACVKEFSMELRSDGSISGNGKIMYVYQGKAINPAVMMMPGAAIAAGGGFACNLKNGFQIRDWNFTGTVDEQGNVEIRGLPGEQLDLLNVGKWQKITAWSPLPPDGPGAAMKGPFHMQLTVEENSQPVIHVDQWLDLGDKLIRRVHYQARILRTDENITPDCKYEAPKKPKCPQREYLKTKIKYAPKNGVTVEASKDLGTGEVGTKTGVKGSGDSGSVEAGVDSKGNVSLEGTYGSATGSVKVNINDGSYQMSVGVGVDTGKLTPRGFPGKIKEKIELTYDSKCGWGIKGTLGGEAFGASAAVEGCVFLTAGP